MKCKYYFRYGESCSLASQCVPQSAGMTCAPAYTGASNVCRCSSTTQYFDSSRELCTALKSYNKVCRDSTECYDAYNGNGYCGFIPGGSESVCRCKYNYYSTTNNYCTASIKVGSNCLGLTQPECEYNSYCSSTNNKCTCGPFKFQDKSGGAKNGYCYYLGFSGDPCDSSQTTIQCFGGTCTAANTCP